MFQIAVSDHAALVVHAYLLGGDVLATWAVGIGILWESEALNVRHEMANKLVLWGVVLETVCSIALFTFDEGVSRAQQSTIEAQQSKIIVLETQIAPRDLNPQQQKDVADAIRPFKGTKFILAVHEDVETLRLLDKLEDAALAGGWEEEETPPQRPTFRRMGRPPVGIRMVAGVWVCFHVADPKIVVDAALALRKALDAQGLVGATFAMTDDDPRQPAGAVHIWVGGKP